MQGQTSSQGDKWKAKWAQTSHTHVEYVYGEKKKKGQATTLCNIGVNLRLAGEKTLTIA